MTTLPQCGVQWVEPGSTPLGFTNIKIAKTHDCCCECSLKVKQFGQSSGDVILDVAGHSYLLEGYLYPCRCGTCGTCMAVFPSRRTCLLDLQIWGPRYVLKFESIEFERGRKCSWLVHSDFRKLRLIEGV